MSTQKKKKTSTGKIVLFVVEIVALIALLLVMWFVLKTTDSEKGVKQVKEFPFGFQAVYQVCSHEPPDGSARADMQRGSADKIDQQCRSEYRRNVNQQVLSSSDPVLKYETVDDKCVHVAGQVKQAHMQETARHETYPFPFLKRSCHHSVSGEYCRFAAGQFIQSDRGIKQDQDKRNPRDRNDDFPVPNVHGSLRFLLRCPCEVPRAPLTV